MMPSSTRLDLISLLADRLIKLEDKVAMMQAQQDTLHLLPHSGYNTFSDGLHMAWELEFDTTPRKLQLVRRHRDGDDMLPMDLTHQQAIMFRTQVQVCVEVDNVVYSCLIGEPGEPVMLIDFVKDVERWLQQPVAVDQDKLGNKLQNYQVSLFHDLRIHPIKFLKLSPALVQDDTGVQDHMLLELY